MKKHFFVLFALPFHTNYYDFVLYFLNNLISFVLYVIYFEVDSFAFLLFFLHKKHTTKRGNTLPLQVILFDLQNELLVPYQNYSFVLFVVKTLLLQLLKQ